ncbi:MAG: carbohydrate kinase family protein [Anaerolineae bacterium]|nr:MAG: carbohydrate kinase family protein [Anaerolineae bacterium]
MLSRDFYITPDDRPVLDVPGGNALYSAIGLKIWEHETPPGLIARVGEDFPRQWLDDFARHGLDIRGVNILPQPLDLRDFYVFAARGRRQRDNPIRHFARLELPLPKALLGYQPPTDEKVDSRIALHPTSIRHTDIPPAYEDAVAAHICPLDFLTHSLLPAVLRQHGITTVTLDPGESYMTPTFFNDVASLLPGLTAFLPAEEDLLALFERRTDDLWEIAEALAAYGCEIIVIKRGERGQMLYDAAGKARWEIPAYPSQTNNMVGVGDAFCGGFLVGFRRTFDPLEAVLYGNISASLVGEGEGVFYALDATPGLAEARREALRPMARKV